MATSIFGTKSELVRLDIEYEDGTGETTAPLPRWDADLLLATFRDWRPDGKRVVRARLVLPVWGTA